MIINPATCSIIAPEYVSQMTFALNDDELSLAECINPYGHFGPHRFKTPDGTIWEWEYDYSCGCESCLEDEDGMCAILWDVKNENNH
jgi:hypothetical protein